MLGIAIAAMVVFAVVMRGRDELRIAGPTSAAAPSADSARARARIFWERYRTATDYRTEGKLGEAAASYTEALALDSVHEDALYYLGNVERELGRCAEAERAWRRLVAVNPRSDRGHGRLGELHLCLEDPAWRDLPRAEEEFQMALRINREQIGPLLRLGQVALLARRTREAAGYFDAVLGTNTGSGPAHYYSGFLAWKSGDTRSALHHYEQALSSTPPPAKGSNEGDTKNAPPPTPLQDPTCPAFQTHLVTVGGSAARETMEASYRELDEYLAHLR
jgi:tetratricopeptide (TPR) repeat protein